MKPFKTEEEFVNYLLDSIRDGFKQVFDRHGVGILKTHFVSFDIPEVGEEPNIRVNFIEKN